MPVEKWSDAVVIVHLGDDPQFTDDMESLEASLLQSPKNAVLDMAALKFINSSNIARLLKVRKSIVSKEKRLFLCGMTNHVWGAFLITGLDKVFEFSNNVSTALATLQMA